MEANQRACPFCGEVILAVARKCKHCGEWLDKAPAAPLSEPPALAPEVLGWMENAPRSRGVAQAVEIDAVEFDDLDDLGLAGLTGPTVFGTMWRFCVGSIPGAFAFVFFAFGVYVRGHGRRITTALERVPAQVLSVTLLIAIAVSVAVGILCGGAFHLAARNLLGSGRDRGLGEPGWLVVVAGASIVLAGALGFVGVEIVDGWLQSETTAFVKNATVFYVSAGVGALGGALFAVQPFRR